MKRQIGVVLALGLLSGCGVLPGTVGVTADDGMTAQSVATTIKTEVKRSMKAAFQKLDQKHSGKVTKDEVTATGWEANFDAMDANKDGILTVTEVTSSPLVDAGVTEVQNAAGRGFTVLNPKGVKAISADDVVGAAAFTLVETSLSGAAAPTLKRDMYFQFAGRDGKMTKNEFTVMLARYTGLGFKYTFAAPAPAPAPSADPGPAPAPVASSSAAIAHSFAWIL